MTDKPNDDKFYLIGKLYSNLQSLEFVLRAALYDNKSKPHNPIEYGMSINTFSVGDIVPENALTDYSTLKQLIDRYNKEIAKDDPLLMVDNAIVTIRDALAHGRVSSNSPEDDMMILKFDIPKNSQVKVVFAQKMTKDWFKEKISKVYNEVLKVSSPYRI